MLPVIIEKEQIAQWDAGSLISKWLIDNNFHVIEMYRKYITDYCTQFGLAEDLEKYWTESAREGLSSGHDNIRKYLEYDLNAYYRSKYIDDLYKLSGKFNSNRMNSNDSHPGLRRYMEDDERVQFELAKIIILQIDIRKREECKLFDLNISEIQKFPEFMKSYINEVSLNYDFHKSSIDVFGYKGPSYERNLKNDVTCGFYFDYPEFRRGRATLELFFYFKKHKKNQIITLGSLENIIWGISQYNNFSILKKNRFWFGGYRYSARVCDAWRFSNFRCL